MRFLSLIEISIFMDFQKGLARHVEHMKISKNSYGLYWHFYWVSKITVRDINALRRFYWLYWHFTYLDYKYPLF